MSKIYCKNCRHFTEGAPETIRELCTAPENFKDTHKEENELSIALPRIINRFNDCVWYDAIEDDTGSSSSSSSSGECILDMP